MRHLMLLAVLLLPFTFATAQDAPPAVAQVEIVQEAEAPVFKIKKTGSFPIQELLRAYAQITGKVFLYDPRKFQFDVTLMAGEDERVFAGHDLDLLVQNALEHHWVGMYECMPNVLAIIPLIEIGTVARHVALDDLDTANPSQWARVVYTPRHLDSNGLRAVLQTHISRRGGQASPLPGAGVVIVERIDRLRDLLKLIRDLDTRSAITLQVYDAPEGVRSGAAADALQRLLGAGLQSTSTRFAGVEGTQRVLAYATEETHAQIPEVLAKMK